jgi:predicted O-methyltransferase YrrM
MTSLIEYKAKEADISWGNLYYHLLPKIIRENNYKSCIEIGVGFGGHAICLIEAGIEEYIGIDPYVCYSNGFNDGPNDFSQLHYDHLYLFVEKRLQGNTLIRKPSKEAFLQIDKTRKYDVLFIDGDHRYEPVLEELYMYGGLIREGGFLGGHDYNPEGFPGVVKAIHEFAEITGKKLVVHDGYVWQLV